MNEKNLRGRTKWCVARTRCSASLVELEEGALAAGVRSVVLLSSELM
eukprot:COSAG03_NODE_17485_length_374_cov_1.305455_1_plen_46_part_10